LEGVFDVEDRLRVLREAAERALEGAATSVGASAASRLASEKGGLVLAEALEECGRLVEQQGRYRSEIARLRGEKARASEQLASLKLRVKAFEHKSRESDSGSPDATSGEGAHPSRDWVKVSETLVNGMEPGEAVLTLKEAARSRAAFEALQALVARQADSGTMETLHLVKRLSALDAQLAHLQAEAEERQRETKLPPKEEE